MKSLAQELRDTTTCHKEEKDALSADVSKLKKVNNLLDEVSGSAQFHIKELPALRRTHPFTKKAKIFSRAHVHCYDGYMVNNNNNMRGCRKL